jgi:hypothetical protein
MSKSKLPIDEMLKSVSNLASAVSLLGFQHFGDTLSSIRPTQPNCSRATCFRGSPILDRFDPRGAIREVMSVAWHAAALAQRITSGEDKLFLQEFQNKLESFSLFEHIDYALNLDAFNSQTLSQLVNCVAALDPSISVWATEGVGHYFANCYLANHNEAHALMSDPDLLELSKASLVPLNAGLGLALAEWLLETRNQPLDRRAIDAYVGLCRNNCSPGYEGVGFEALGLAARSLHPHLISPIDALLSIHYPDLVDYFWHGIGRALYFSPTQFLPLCSGPWQGFDMSFQEPPHESGRRNAVAGYIWALTLVNIRNPEIVAEFLSRKATHLLEPRAFVNGLCSALIIWNNAQPGQRQVEDFIDHRAGLSEGRLSRLWTTYVQLPWDRTLRDHSWDERRLGSLFRYQSLVGVIDSES